MVTDSEPDDLAIELFERSREVVALDAPQVEAWVSGLFAVWGPHDGDRFVAHCRRIGDPAAALLCRAIGELDSGGLGRAARSVASELADRLPPAAAAVGESVARRAWRVTAPFGDSVIIGFVGSVDDGSAAADHALLVELDDRGLIADLLLSGPPETLLAELRPVGPAEPDDRDQRARAMTVDELSPRDAAEAIATAWRASAAQPAVYDESVGANERFVRRRVEALLEDALPPLQHTEAEVDPRRGMTADEFDEANRAARSTIQAALGDAPPEPVGSGAAVDAWVQAIRGEIEGASARELEALHWLEWADWLGAGIGLVRSGPGAPVDGESLVDQVNRCPEVSSSISASDREFTAASFDLAIDHVAAAGCVADGRLTRAGHLSLHRALFVAWSDWHPGNGPLATARDQ